MFTMKLSRKDPKIISSATYQFRSSSVEWDGLTRIHKKFFVLSSSEKQSVNTHNTVYAHKIK